MIYRDKKRILRNGWTLFLLLTHDPKSAMRPTNRLGPESSSLTWLIPGPWNSYSHGQKNISQHKKQGKNSFLTQRWAKKTWSWNADWCGEVRCGGMGNGAQGNWPWLGRTLNVMPWSLHLILQAFQSHWPNFRLRIRETRSRKIVSQKIGPWVTAGWGRIFQRKTWWLYYSVISRKNRTNRRLRKEPMLQFQVCGWNSFLPRGEESGRGQFLFSEGI